MNTKLNSSRSSVRLAVSGVVAALGCAAVPAQAAVNLSLFENATTPHSVNVTPGGTFSVTLNLVSTAEQLTGVDYYFNISGAASGKFRLTGRDITGSPFSDLLKVNTGDNGSNGGVLDSNFSLLTPLNSLDLGAAIGNVSSALPPNTGANPASYLLAKYTFALASDIPVGTYTLSTYYFAGTEVEGTAKWITCRRWRCNIEAPYEGHTSSLDTVGTAMILRSLTSSWNRPPSIVTWWMRGFSTAITFNACTTSGQLWQVSDM